MPAGFEVFNAAGQRLVSVTSRLPRVIGQVASGTANGSISVPVGFGENIWAYAEPTSVGSETSNPIKISIQSSSVSWSWDFALGRMTANIIYGVY